MRLQRQAQGLVIGHHLFAERHLRQIGQRLGPLVLAGAEQRQIGRIAQGAGLPQGGAAIQPHRAEGIGRRQRPDRAAVQPGAKGQIGQSLEGLLPRAGQPFGGLAPQPIDLPQAQPQGKAVARGFQRVVPFAEIHIGLAQRHPVLARVAHDLGRGIEPHRLRIQQRAGEGGRVMALQPA